MTVNKEKKAINWLTFEEAVELNKKDPKPLLIDISTTWCGWCKRMQKDTYSNSNVIKVINEHFYAVELDGEHKEDIIFNGHTFKFVKNGRRGYHELASSLMNGKLSYPTTVFLNEKVQMLQAIPGYQSKTDFHPIVTYLSDTNIYTNIDWQTYKDSVYKSPF